ncbi:hypothetical protein QR680_007723 [Steinernema hermaphroditum]|uniref:Uncharacterized protein n=1 Tax=Steinernema hermaphroditum TaxID=289476 RepID=A0AA39IE25_9BILA|nr:hypothetical protein QR680_007723 [Steinernema hermaphroditum]
MAVQTPCFNCTLLETGNFILGCCRAVYCAICIGYYLEDCEDDRSICLNNTVCKAQAQEGLIFEFEAYVDALWAKRRAEEEAESELQAHREAAILSLKKVASLPQKILVSLPKKREEEVKSKKVVFDLEPTRAPEEKASRKRRSPSDCDAPKPKRIPGPRFGRFCREQSRHRGRPAGNNRSH